MDRRSFLGAAGAASLVTVAAEPLGAQVRDYFRVYIRNSCNRRIQAAIHAIELHGQWVTKGWYILNPGEEAYVADTRNRIIYLYAESIAPLSERIYWDGDDNFHYIRGSDRQYGFRISNITNSDWSRWTENLTCN